MTYSNPLTPSLHQNGHTEIARLLLEQPNIDLTIPEKDGYTPVHGAGFQGRAEIMRLLHAAGADIKNQHSDGYQPIHRVAWGREQRHAETLKVA